MAFKKKGTASDGNTIRVVTENPAPDLSKMASKSDKIVCGSCGRHIGMRVGDVYHILDKRYVSLSNVQCPKCGKPILADR